MAGSKRHPAWGRVAKAALERDGHTCQRPGPRCTGTANLEVHHIIPIARGGAELDIDNCLTLCHNDHVRLSRRPVPCRWTDPA